MVNEQEPTIAVPESLLKRLVAELKRLRQLESRYMQEEAEMTWKEISPVSQEEDNKKDLFSQEEAQI